MNSTGEVSGMDEGRRLISQSRRFPAYIGCFYGEEMRSVIDELTRWVEDSYRRELQERPSKHVYIRRLPGDVIGKIDRLRDSTVIRNAITSYFPPATILIPMKHTDELYISHYNKDLGGDQGLYSRHYDGNLRVLPGYTVVRALIYLQSDQSYKVIFGSSQVEKAFTTYEFGLLDFHRELHWVEGRYDPDSPQRILLKCNYLVAPANRRFVTAAVLGANTAVFYVVKAAMEYSKSPKNPAQVLIGLLCNLFRLLNNVHPLVPLLFILLVIATAGWGLIGLLY